jgi:hypothetical protein
MWPRCSWSRKASGCATSASLGARDHRDRTTRCHWSWRSTATAKDLPADPLRGQHYNSRATRLKRPTWRDATCRYWCCGWIVWCLSPRGGGVLSWPEFLLILGISFLEESRSQVRASVRMFWKASFSLYSTSTRQSTHEHMNAITRAREKKLSQRLFRKKKNNLIVHKSSLVTKTEPLSTLCQAIVLSLLCVSTSLRPYSFDGTPKLRCIWSNCVFSSLFTFSAINKSRQMKTMSFLTAFKTARLNSKPNLSS